MYKIIGFPKTRTIRVIWMMEELGQPYDIIPLKPGDEKIKAYNPTGKIPVLMVGDTALIDSVAIVQFLADCHGQLTAVAGTLTRALQDSWSQFAMDDIELPLWVNAKHNFILPEDLRSQTARDAAHYEFQNALIAFGKRLGDRAYVMGDDFSVPDLLMGHCANWAEKGAGWEIPAGPVKDYFDRVRDRDALRRAEAVRDQYS